MENKLKFRLVFKRKINMYQLEYTDKYGEWIIDSTYQALSKTGEPMGNSNNLEYGLINEELIWDMEQLRLQDYEFIGIYQDWSE